MSEPREWILEGHMFMRERPGGPPGNYVMPVAKEGPFLEINETAKVVEYSAYEKLKEYVLRHEATNCNKFLIEERDKLRAELEELRLYEEQTKHVGGINKQLQAELEQLKNYSGETDARLTEAWEHVKSLEIVKKQEESFFKQRNELQADLAVAVEALEHYESAHYDHRGFSCRADKTATEALAKIKGDK